MKKNIIFLFLSILTGLFLSNYIVNEYKTYSKVKAHEQDKILYFYQYAAFKNEDNMKNSLKNIKYYFYYKENDVYHVILAISKNPNISEKIKSANKLDNLYVKKVIVDDKKIVNIINKYDTLVNTKNVSEEILELEGKILSEYNKYYEKSFDK